MKLICPACSVPIPAQQVDVADGMATCPDGVQRIDLGEAAGVELVVTRQNHEPVVVMSLAELEGLRETLHLLSTPANVEHLRRSIGELDDGKGKERDLAEA